MQVCLLFRNCAFLFPIGHLCNILGTLRTLQPQLSTSVYPNATNHPVPDLLEYPVHYHLVCMYDHGPPYDRVLPGQADHAVADRHLGNLK